MLSYLVRIQVCELIIRVRESEREKISLTQPPLSLTSRGSFPTLIKSLPPLSHSRSSRLALFARAFWEFLNSDYLPLLPR